MRPKSRIFHCVLACCLLTAAAMTTFANATRHTAGNVSTVVLGNEPVELALCDCEFATGPPNGLSCDKEGWFVSSFEREGSWVTGGGLVPLSRARCCRPCLPSELPDSQGQLAPDAKAVAVVSIGCHKSSGQGSEAMKCEPQGGSFVTGFTEALRVSNAANYYYPVGAVDCCTPSVLLSTGDAWELERCDCSFSTDINCGEKDSNRLLQGFERWKITAMALFVPVAPAQCCKTCLSNRIHPLDSCSDLNFCSGHGVCNLGSCDCLDGYGGPDCGSQLGGRGTQLPQWLISLIILGSCVTASTFLLVGGRLVRFLAERQLEEDEEEDSEGVAEPLILRIDQDDRGSVGSEDTTRFDSDEDQDALPPGVYRGTGPGEEEAVGGGVLIQPARQGEEEDPAAQSFVVPVPNGIQLETRQRSHQEAGTGAETAEVGASDSDEEGDTPEELQRIQAAADSIRHEPPEAGSPQAVEEIQEAQHDTQTAPSLDELHVQDEEESDLAKDPKKELMQEQNEDPTAVLRGAECTVCMNRPVQVVVIPCGHACMCRRCSRRLDRCPVCRKEILRRQRIFLGG